MKSIKNENDYWFTIEPYVFINITNKCALLYNTLDGATFESDKEEIIDLLRELLQESNCGVVLLTKKRYKQKDVNNFIRDLREKFMGDIIDVNLSKGKPVQLLPYCNFPRKQEIYKKHNFSSLKNVLKNLSEVSIHLGATVNLIKLLPFLQSLSQNTTINLIGRLGKVAKYSEIMFFFEQHLAPINILCSYKNIINLKPEFENNFSYRISVSFPIDMKQWDISLKLLLNQTLPFEYVFDVTSEEDIKQTEQLIEQFQIEKYRLNPVYTGENIGFFEANVFLSKEDILSTTMTIKDFFSRQAMNIYDYGKINIMPNGDAYANLNHPILGNIYTESIYEIVIKEIEEGQSWLRIRNQAPCNECVYQWLCPPPSNYELVIGRPNLCHVKHL